MTWKTLGESLEAALASMLNEVGDEVAGTRLDAVNGSKRGPDAETPGQVLWRNVPTESGGEAAPVTTQPGKAPASSAHGRGRSAHDKAQPQRRADRPLLYVIEGGGGRRQEGETSAAFRTRAGGGGRGCKLVVIEGGRRHWTASAF